MILARFQDCARSPLTEKPKLLLEAVLKSVDGLPCHLTLLNTNQAEPRVAAPQRTGWLRGPACFSDAVLRRGFSGLPTAHLEGPMLYMLYPPDPRTEEATMREAALCQREGITINIFLLPSWNQSRKDIVFAQRMAESTRGRVFLTGGHDLDRFVLWDYVSMRRRVIG